MQAESDQIEHGEQRPDHSHFCGGVEIHVVEIISGVFELAQVGFLLLGQGVSVLKKCANFVNVIFRSGAEQKCDWIVRDFVLIVCQTQLPQIESDPVGVVCSDVEDRHDPGFNCIKGAWKYLLGRPVQSDHCDCKTHQCFTICQ